MNIQWHLHVYEHSGAREVSVCADIGLNVECGEYHVSWFVNDEHRGHYISGDGE